MDTQTRVISRVSALLVAWEPDATGSIEMKFGRIVRSHFTVAIEPANEYYLD
jgi:hypothetical protein